MTMLKLSSMTSIKHHRRQKTTRKRMSSLCWRTLKLKRDGSDLIWEDLTKSKWKKSTSPSSWYTSTWTLASPWLLCASPTTGPHWKTIPLLISFLGSSCTCYLRSTSNSSLAFYTWNGSKEIRWTGLGQPLGFSGSDFLTTSYGSLVSSLWSRTRSCLRSGSPMN
jgi:hypothetical protein